ncbi:MAG: TonB-dependent receptor domain-containing protein [Gemmatimonadaceae bacterium]
MKHTRLSTVFRAFVALLFSAGVAGAQVTTGSIGGRVTDENGAGLESVQIQVRSTLTGAIRTAVTSASGNYLVLGLEVGTGYDVTARRIGFEPATKRDQNVTIGQTTRVDLQLTTRATVLQSQVIVSEIDPVITATRTGVGTTVSDSALQRLPTLGRNFTDFVALTPQISSAGPGLSGGGTNNRYNNIQIDGATESDLFGLGSTGQPGGQARGKSIGIESVKQYQVLLSPFDVRYGNFAGALINAVTKSGSNTLTGSAYYFFRNENTTRKQDYLSDFKQTQYGFALGGPIIKDRLHFFINPEFQQQTTPAAGPYIGLAGANVPSQAEIDSYNAVLTNLGLPTSTGGSRINENPLTNLFVRFDVNGLPFNSTLVLRHNFGEANDDNFSRSFTSVTFPLLNNGFAFTSKKNATVAQLRSAFNNGWFNEAYLGFTSIRDRRSPFVRGAPQIFTDMGVYNIQSGSERFSQGNELDQDILELTNNLVIPMGDHRFTIGATYSQYKARNLFAQSIFGVWNFNSLADFQAGVANQYIVGVPINGDANVRFTSSIAGVYVQDEWNINSRLNVTLGLRYDVPSFADQPPTNPVVLTDFGRNTADVPSGNGTISPRIGFNYDLTGDQRNQLRGGVGLFAGRPAYVWLSNAFQNSGMGGNPLLTCNAAVAPTLNATTAVTPPTQCTNGTTAALGSEINLLRSDLKFPQNLRASLGFDRNLGNGLVATFEALYTKGINTLFYQNIALADPIGTDRNGRVMYGPRPNVPNLRIPGRNLVLDVSNQSRDEATQLTAGISRRWRSNWEGSLFYTWSRVMDVQGLTSSTAFSQYRFGRPAGIYPQETPVLQRSLFEQPHRIVASGTYTYPAFQTAISVTYFGESGSRYHYLYGGGSNGDLNGDGVGNDLIYIPTSTTDLNEIIFVASGSTTIAAQQQSFERFIDSNACLNNQRGKIMTPNSCVEPWRNTVNLSVRQSIGALGLGSVLNTSTLNRLTVQWDVFNLANFINRDWGAIRTAGFPGGNILNLSFNSLENAAGTLVNGGTRPRFVWNTATQALNQRNIQSNYRMQLSVRYSF